MKTIGQELKEIRQRRNIELEEISEKTNIKLAYLISIEKDEFNEIPTFVHAKGFVRSYANYIGLDGTSYSKKLSEVHKNDNEEELKQESESVSVSKVQIPINLDSVKDELIYLLKKNKNTIILTIIVIISVFVIYKAAKFAIVSVIDLFNKPDVEQIENSENNKLNNNVKDLSDKVNENVSNYNEQNNLLANSDFLQLEASAISNVWISVEVDGELVFEGLLTDKSEEIWTAKHEIKLKIADAGALKFSLNGKDIGSPGKKGEIIKNLVITKDGFEYN